MPFLQACYQLIYASLQGDRKLGGRCLRTEGDNVCDQFLTRRRIAHRTPEHYFELRSQLLTEKRDKRTLTDATHAQDGDESAVLLKDPLGELGQFHLAALEAAHI